jgi:ADP-ribose pyrophosphatase
MQPWKTLERQELLNHSKYLKVENHSIQMPDGRVMTNWPWVITREYAIVLALTTQGEYICFRQTKYGVQGDTLAPAGGFIEPGEEPLEAAKRELLEETGYVAAEWVNLGQYRVDGNIGCGVAHLFLACQAQWAREPVSDDLEEQVLLRLSRQQIEEALRNGEFKVLAWATTVALALLHL